MNPPSRLPSKQFLTNSRMLASTIHHIESIVAAFHYAAKACSVQGIQYWPPTGSTPKCVCSRNGQEDHRTETGINLHEPLAKPLQLDESAGRQNKMKVAVT